MTAGPNCSARIIKLIQDEITQKSTRYWMAKQTFHLLSQFPSHFYQSSIKILLLWIKVEQNIFIVVDYFYSNNFRYA